MSAGQDNAKPSTQAERLRQASQERREQQKEGLRRTILTAAGELFLEHGYEGFSMRQAAERIGYSATTIYRYYENKDDLLFAIVYEGFVQFRDRLLEAFESTDNPFERISALGWAYIRFGTENPVYYQMMFMHRADFLFESRAAETEPMIGSFNVLQRAVAEAMEAGVIKRGDLETTSHVFWAVVHGITALAIANPKQFTPEYVARSAALAMEMTFDGLRRR